MIAIADRMPDIGKSFYETGPGERHRHARRLSEGTDRAGVLKVDDREVAAAQFLDACQATLFKPVLFNFAPPPSPERVDYVIGIAVRTFMAAYGAK